MLDPKEIYSRKNKVLYDSLGNEVLKFTEHTVDTSNLTGDLVDNMNKFISCYPNRIEIIEKQQLTLF